jgi:phenylalanyl-tRNA synthetase beta chain
MQLACSWLNALLVNEKDLSPVTLAPEVMGEALTGAGLEIEGAIERQGSAFSGVVVAKVVALNPHPNAEKLRLATITTGSKEQTVVCGAQNLKEHHWVALAQVGATVYSPKQQAWFQLTPAPIRGVSSEGMICSLDELDLAGQYPAPEEPGIWPINHLVSEADLGKPLQAVLNLPTEAILHSAPTANRGDHMAYLGVARELAALFHYKVQTPKTLPELPAVLSLTEPAWQLDERHEAVCSYYSISLVKNVRIEPSPEWMQQRLLASGVRPINNVVDVTNYVMLETGHPLHAFDAEKLKALNPQATTFSLGVRPATKGETLTTLDDLDRRLPNEAVVITFNQQPVALAGVMGGAATAVCEQTTSLVLECATFSAASTRKSSRSVGLRSESSARYERNVPASGCHFALKRALYLLQTLAGATVQGTLQAGHAEEPETFIRLRLS